MYYPPWVIDLICIKSGFYKSWAEDAKVLSDILRKMSFKDIREILGVLFWKIQILWPSESFG